MLYHAGPLTIHAAPLVWTVYVSESQNIHGTHGIVDMQSQDGIDTMQLIMQANAESIHHVFLTFDSSSYQQSCRV